LNCVYNLDCFLLVGNHTKSTGLDILKMNVVLR
jgi:hypothetical protein